MEGDEVQEVAGPVISTGTRLSGTRPTAPVLLFHDGARRWKSIIFVKDVPGIFSSRVVLMEYPHGHISVLSPSNVLHHTRPIDRGLYKRYIAVIPGTLNGDLRRTGAEMSVSKITMPVFCKSTPYRALPGQAGWEARDQSTVGENGSYNDQFSLRKIKVVKG
jgi:hypothetical protein